MNKTNCPACGKEGKLEPHPTQKERLILICSCNPAGPVLETDVLVVVKTERDSPSKKESK